MTDKPWLTEPVPREPEMALRVGNLRGSGSEFRRALYTCADQERRGKAVGAEFVASSPLVTE